MKQFLPPACFALLALLSPRLAGAEVTLNNFSAFQSPTTFFSGDWEQSGSASTSPRASFSQGAGFYIFKGGFNADTSSAEVFFDAPLDLSGYSLLAVSAQILAGNQATTFSVSLLDSSGAARAFAVFATGNFSQVGFSTVTAALTFTPGFNPADILEFRIGGETLGGAELLNFSVDNLTALSPVNMTPVPESSSMAIAAAAFLATIVGTRRFRAARDVAKQS